jgi:hypothetical protein
MSTTAALNPPSVRYPFESEIADLSPGLQQAHRYAFNGLVDVNQAIVALKSQVDANKTSITSAATTENVNTTSENTTVITQNTVGFVNSQIGITSYATQQSDYGSFVLFADASAVAVNLTAGPTIQTPWYCVAINFGPSTVTFTPASGTISYGTTSGAGSMPLLAGYFAIISFDGTLFWAAVLPLVPATFAPITNEFLTGYDATSASFSAAQPSFSNISGTATAAQVPALSALTGQITEAQLPSAGLTGTVTLAALTGGGTQGSISYTNGIITGVVDPT